MPVAGLLPSWLGTRAYDCEGACLGAVADVLFDDVTHRPGWLLLTPLREGGDHLLVPACGARQLARGVELAFARRLVRRAPAGVAPPGELGREHAAALARHYGVPAGDGPWSGIAAPRPARAQYPSVL